MSELREWLLLKAEGGFEVCVSKAAYEAAIKERDEAKAALLECKGDLACAFVDRDEARAEIAELRIAVADRSEKYKLFVDNGLWDKCNELTTERAKSAKLVEALTKIGKVDHPSISDKTSWIVILESVCALARRTLAEFEKGSGGG